MKKLFNIQKGFTLIEIIIVLSIMGIIANIAAMMIYQAAQSSISQYEFSETESNARLVMERLTKELHAIKSNSEISTNDSNQIVFEDLDGNNVDIEFVSNELLINNHVLANNVDTTNSKFSYFDPDGAETSTNTEIVYIGIKITLTEGNKTLQAQTKVLIL